MVTICRYAKVKGSGGAIIGLSLLPARLTPIGIVSPVILRFSAKAIEKSVTIVAKVISFGLGFLDCRKGFEDFQFFATARTASIISIVATMFIYPSSSTAKTIASSIANRCFAMNHIGGNKSNSHSQHVCFYKQGLVVGRTLGGVEVEFGTTWKIIEGTILIMGEIPNTTVCALRPVKDSKDIEAICGWTGHWKADGEVPTKK
jgi:hypothetical protein